MGKKKRLPKNILLGYRNLMDRGGVLVRQFSDSEEAVKRGGNYVYFTMKDNLKFATAAGRFFVENEIVKSNSDGLFDDTPQSFKAISRAEFEHFKERYEQV